MGYRELKNQTEEKIKKWKRILLAAFVVFLVALLIFSTFYPPESWKYYFSTPKFEQREEKEMRVHYLDVGQGDCIFIELPDGKTMLVDGGGDNVEKTILRYLNGLKVDVIDYLVVTHSDEDHCGAIAEIVRVKTVLNAYLPASYNLEHGKYAEAYAALSQSDCQLFVTNATMDLSSNGEALYTLSFLYPNAQGEAETDNEMSAVFWLDYMGVSFLFTGDAPKAVEEQLIINDQLDLFKNSNVDLASTEFLKVAHHGSALSSSKTFLSYLNVKKAIISCGKDNTYGHPADGVVESLQTLGVAIYRTDEGGHVVTSVKADGTYSIDYLNN